jgi:hypothetical protein
VAVAVQLVLLLVIALLATHSLLLVLWRCLPPLHPYHLSAAAVLAAEGAVM